MPQCVSCPKKQAILNAGNLCKSCFDNNADGDEIRDEDEEVDPLADEDLDKPINLATLRDISNIVKKLTSPIVKKMENLVKPIKEKANSNANKIALLEANLKEKETKIEAMSQIIVNMQSSLNAIDATKRNTNIIISGLPEDNIECDGRTLESDDDKVKCLFEIMEVEQDASDPPVQLEISRIGAPKDNSIRLIKVNMKSKAKRDVILKKAPMLKTKSEGWKKVYVKKDLHPVYTKENKRIYSKMKELKEKNPTKDIKIDKGKLLVDGKVVDSNTFFV